MALCLFFACFIIASEVSTSVGAFSCYDIPKHKNFRLLPRTDVCGMSSFSNRIMGGQNADLGEFPWMAILFIRSRNGMKKAACGGAVINYKYVLTAAHCVTPLVEKPAGSKLVVVLGEYDMAVEGVDCLNRWCAPPPVQLEVEQIVIHGKSGRKSQFQNDIALLRVTSFIPFNRFVSPVCLPTSCLMMNHRFVEAPLSVAGWGNTFDVPVRNLNSVQQKITVTGVPLEECQRAWSSQKVTGSQLCAGGRGDKDTCHGDSGGPLVFHNSREGPPVHYVVVGVVSQGEGCAQGAGGRAPGIYTRVGAFMQWILDHIRE